MSYPEISDDDFNKKITKIFSKYKIIDKKKSYNEYCSGKKFKQHTSQKFLPDFLSPKTPYYKLLIFHKIGSGKTCTAIRIAEQWKKRKQIVVLVPASLKGNFRNELRSSCVDNEYISLNDRKKLKLLSPKSEEYKSIIAKSDLKINKYYNIYSYHKFIQLVETKKINFKNTLLIVDEIQNMISEKGKFYSLLKSSIENAPEDLMIVLLSATPMFDKPHEIALTMNLLGLSDKLPEGYDFNNKFIKTRKSGDKYVFKVKNIDIFKHMIKGYVSYFSGAPMYVFPEMKIRHIKCEMSSFQYNIYKKILENENRAGYNITKYRTKEELLKKITIEDLPNNFFMGTRIVSNIVFPNHKVGEKGLESLTNEKIRANLSKYSVKFDIMINKINKCVGKLFVYSNFKEYGGIKSFEKVLIAFGYKDYAKYGSGHKRYAIFSGDITDKYKEEVKDIYNRIDNLYGDKLKILLGTPSIKEGITLLNVKQVHIMEPYWNLSRMRQIMGRANRFCSHKDLPSKKRIVKVYIYIITYKDVKTIDEYIQYIANQKSRLIKDFEKALKEASIDCELNFNLTKYEDDTVVCMK